MRWSSAVSVLSYTGHPWEPSFSFQRRYRLLFGGFFVCLFIPPTPPPLHSTFSEQNTQLMHALGCVTLQAIRIFLYTLSLSGSFLSGTFIHCRMSPHVIYLLCHQSSEFTPSWRLLGFASFPAFKTTLLHTLTSSENNCFEKSVQSVFSNFAFCLKATNRS